jgi:hypothetical protein
LYAQQFDETEQRGFSFKENGLVTPKGVGKKGFFLFSLHRFEPLLHELKVIGTTICIFSRFYRFKKE